MSEPKAYQAEPFEETLDAFVHRVTTNGGTVEEHYAIRKIEQMKQQNADLTEQVRVLREALEQARAALVLAKSDESITVTAS